MAKTYHAWVGFIDLLVVLACALTVWHLVEPISTIEPYMLLTTVVSAILLPLASLFGLHVSFRAQSIFAWVRQLTLLWLTLSLAIVIVLWMTKQADTFSRLWIATWLLSAWLVSIGWRLAAFSVLKRSH